MTIEGIEAEEKRFIKFSTEYQHHMGDTSGMSPEDIMDEVSSAYYDCIDDGTEPENFCKWIAEYFGEAE